MWRVLLGFLLAPVPLAIAFVVLVSLPPAPADLGTAALAVLVMAYGPTLLFGLPTHLLLRRFGRRRLWHYLAASMALPILLVLCAFGFELIEWDEQTPLGLPTAMVGGMASVAAALTAFLFWLVAIWRSPEPGLLGQAKLSAVFD